MKMTVLVPTYRRPQDVERCLKALQQQNCAADEVLVVRDTDDVIHTFLKTFESETLSLRTVAVTVPGVVAAMNVGFEAATEEIISVTDDAAPYSDWLKCTEAQFQSDEDLGGVGGRDYVYLGTQLLEGAVKWIC